MMNFSLTFIFTVILNLISFISFSQIDQNKLDSLVRQKMSENWNKNKKPLSPDEVWEIRRYYIMKNDSTFISQLNQKIQTAPKSEVMMMVTKWLDVFNQPNSRDLDSTWQQIMKIFYSYDKDSCKSYCRIHQWVKRIYAEDRYKDYGLLGRPLRNNLPYIDFLYKNYPLTDVLPILMQDNEFDQEEKLQTAYGLYMDFKTNQCKNDTTCINNANEYIKYYFLLNNVDKPNIDYINAFKNIKQTQAELLRVRLEKIKQNKADR